MVEVDAGSGVEVLEDLVRSDLLQSEHIDVLPFLLGEQVVRIFGRDAGRAENRHAVARRIAREPGDVGDAQPGVLHGLAHRHAVGIGVERRGQAHLVGRQAHPQALRAE